ncbi:MGMT family protein [Nocardioides sp. BGMRC 2183]|nr:MGMT family protein [Nocardioides sp. BGMRC 2183]
MPGARDPDYVERILDLVEQVPPGRVTTYGALADVVGGGPRQVGTVMAHHGGAVPWWRVIRADGSLPPSHQAAARPHYDDERTPTLPSGKVDVRSAFWSPR